MSASDEDIEFRAPKVEVSTCVSAKEASHHNYS